MMAVYVVYYEKNRMEESKCLLNVLKYFQYKNNTKKGALKRFYDR